MSLIPFIVPAQLNETNKTTIDYSTTSRYTQPPPFGSEATVMSLEN